MKRFIPLLCLTLFCSTVFPQLQSRYVFNRFGKINGMSADAAYTVTQDNDGFIWIGTENGLQRFDGTRFLSFHHSSADIHSIPHNSVEHIFFDKEQRLWLRINGLHAGYFDVHTFQYHPVKLSIPDSLRNNSAYRFEEADNRVTLMIQNYGMVTYDEKANEFSAAYNIIKFSDGTIPAQFSKDELTGNYWVSSKKGFDLYDIKTKRFIPRKGHPILDTMNRIVTEGNAFGPVGAFTDRAGRFWCNIWSFKKGEGGPNVFRYDPSQHKWTSFKKSIDEAAKSYHTIEKLTEQRDGTIWLYGGSLFAKLNEEKNIFEDVRNESLKENGLDVANIFNIYEDREANLWLASTNGLYLFNPGRQSFTNFPNRRNDDIIYTNSIDDIIQLKNGNIITTAWGAGIFYYDHDLKVIPNPITPEAKKNYGTSVWDVLERNNGELWLGMQEGALRIFDQHTAKLTELRLKVFDGRTIRQVAEDDLGNTWLGTQGGYVIKCTNGNWKDSSSFKVLQRFKGYIIKIVPDGVGKLWVGTDRFGVYQLDAASGNIINHYDEKSPNGKRLQEAGVADILVYNDSLTLFACGSVNILNTKTGMIRFFGSEEGLPAENVVSLIKDKAGSIWIGLQSGICKLSLERGAVSTYGPPDGINNSRIQLNSAAVLNDGRVLFGTTTDLLLYDPAKAGAPQKPLSVGIAGFRVFDKPLRPDSLLALDKITLPYTDNAISIDLTTYTYTQHYSCLYMLEGIDKDWKVSNNMQVSYNYLAPGKYVFKTKSSQPGQHQVVTRLLIDIEPPFWKTGWFFGIVVLTILGILYLLDHERIKRIKATQQLRTDIALGLHDDVNTALNNINLLSEMARMKADKDLARSKELIEQIGDKSNRMITSMDDMLWGIDPANDSMESTILRMKEFSDALRNRYQANISIYSDPQVLKLKMDMKLRHELLYIFKEILRCIVMQSGGQQTVVNIGLTQNKLSLSLLDKVNFDPANPDLNKCMEEMKARAASINASLGIHAGSDGSYILLLLQVKKNNFF